MRLIDADAINWFKGEDADGNHVYLLDKRDIDKEPTAFDVDKIVEKLAKSAKESHGNVGMGGEMVVNLDDAIEIVKQGGDVTETKTIRDKATEWNNHSTKKVPYEFIDFVEGKREIAKDDDVCKWREDAYGRWHTQCNILADNSPLEYTYCPYCGKKIKVVE